MEIPVSTYQDIFEVLSDGVILIDETEHIQSINHRALELLQTRDSEVLGKSVEDFVPADARSLYREILLKFAAADTGRVERHDLPLIQIQRPDGSVFPARVTLSKVMKNDTRVIAVVFQDLTRQEADRREILEANRKLQELDNVRQEFIGMAAHDLRAPLHKLSLSAELLADENLPQEKKEQFKGVMSRTILGMQTLVNDLLNIMSIESGKIQLKPVQVPLREFFEETFDLHQRISKNKNIDLEFDCRLSHTHGYFDPDRISQVLNNLLSNALKFSSPNTKVSFAVAEDDDALIITVSDEGPGISEADQKLIFQPFSQAENKPTAGEQSTGLGLAICKRITDLQGGSLTLNSEVGKGSTFTLSLPDTLPKDG